jgi:hypothetical protein
MWTVANFIMPLSRGVLLAAAIGDSTVKLTFGW